MCATLCSTVLHSSTFQPSFITPRLLNPHSLLPPPSSSPQLASTLLHDASLPHTRTETGVLDPLLLPLADWAPARGLTLPPSPSATMPYAAMRAPAILMCAAGTCRTAAVQPETHGSAPAVSASAAIYLPSARHNRSLDILSPFAARERAVGVSSGSDLARAGSLSTNPAADSGPCESDGMACSGPNAGAGPGPGPGPGPTRSNSTAPPHRPAAGLFEPYPTHRTAVLGTQLVPSTATPGLPASAPASSTPLLAQAPSAPQPMRPTNAGAPTYLIQTSAGPMMSLVGQPAAGGQGQNGVQLGQGQAMLFQVPMGMNMNTGMGMGMQVPAGFPMQYMSVMPMMPTVVQNGQVMWLVQQQQPQPQLQQQQQQLLLQGFVPTPMPVGAAQAQAQAQAQAMARAQAQHQAAVPVLAPAAQSLGVSPLHRTLQVQLPAASSSPATPASSSLGTASSGGGALAPAASAAFQRRALAAARRTAAAPRLPPTAAAISPPHAASPMALCPPGKTVGPRGAPALLGQAAPSTLAMPFPDALAAWARSGVNAGGLSGPAAAAALAAARDSVGSTTAAAALAAARDSTGSTAWGHMSVAADPMGEVVMGKAAVGPVGAGQAEWQPRGEAEGEGDIVTWAHEQLDRRGEAPGAEDNWLDEIMNAPWAAV